MEGVGFVEGAGFQDRGEGECIGLDGPMIEHLAVEEERILVKAVEGVCMDESSPGVDTGNRGMIKKKAGIVEASKRAV